MSKYRLILLAVLATGAMSAAENRPSFAAASIRQNPNCSFVPARMSPGRIEYSCVSLRALIALAYGHDFEDERFTFERPMRVLGGPAWLDSERYDILAKAEGAPTTETMIGPMLRALLDERLALRVHKEARETPVYALTVSGTVKLTPSAAGTCSEPDTTSQQATRDAIVSGRLTTPPVYCGSPQQRFDGTTMTTEVHSATMAMFAQAALAGRVDRPVIDKTGLAGRYDIKLEYADNTVGRGPVLLNGMPARTDQALASDPGGPSIFSALQKLGLKLSPEKSAMDVIVIDHVERLSAN